MRGRMNDAKSYVPPFQLDQPMHGGAVGEVVASNAEGFAVGDHVLHGLGWREYAACDAKHAVKVDAALAPLSAYLGVLGMTGLTAYAGLFEVASFKEGDAVFVSGAAGAVGSQVGQIAKLKGASRVIGSAGLGREGQAARRGVRLRRRLQLQERPRRRAAEGGRPRRHRRLLRQRRRRPPRGRHLLAQRARPRRHLRHDRPVYNNTEPAPGPRNLAMLIGKRLRLQGFLVSDHADLQPQFVQEVAGWIASGELKYSETVVEGIENGLEAFLGLLRGENTGKMIVSSDAFLRFPACGNFFPNSVVDPGASRGGPPKEHNRMSIQQSDVLYTAVATAENGRDGRVATDDGQLDVVVNPPKEMGGSGAGTNPEQLFAAGYSACFQGALGVVARQEKADISGSTVTAKVGIGKNGASGFVEIFVDDPGRHTEAAGAASLSRRPTRSARTRRRPAATSP